MGLLYLFLKVFGILVGVFALVMIFFVYPTNVLYNNEKYKIKGEPGLLLIWGVIVLCLINSLMYFFYNYNSNYLCTVTKYIGCGPGTNHIAVYSLMIIHILTYFTYSFLFVNRLYEDIKTNKIDKYLFIFATTCIFFTLLNYNMYGTLYVNRGIMYIPARILLYLSTFSPIYSYLAVNYLVKIEIKKKKKPVKKIEKKDNEKEVKKESDKEVKKDDKKVEKKDKK